MRRSLLAAAALGAPLVFSLALIGCGPPKDRDDQSSSGDTNSSSTSTTSTAAGPLEPLKANYGATLKGTVKIKGATPNRDAATQELQSLMLKADQIQKTNCFDMAPDAEKTQQKWVIDDGGGVGNVVVWIQPPAGKYFEVDLSDPKAKTWKDTVELTQPHCAFIPHVSWAMPFVKDPKDPKKTVATGQTFTVSNTAAVSHNTKWESESDPSLNSQLGTLASGTAPKPVALHGNNALVRFSCNIHPWMDAYVWVFDHPYAAVTDAHGHYEIKNVPAGAKVRVTAWHEMGPNKGYLTPSRIKGDDLELSASGDTTKDFELEVK